MGCASFSGMEGILEGLTLDEVELTASAATYNTYETTYTYENFLNYIFLIVDRSIEISDCIEDAEGELEIPSEIDSVVVTSIGDYAFDNCTKLTGITIPDTVTNIGTEAFYNCTNLKSVAIGNGVTRIKDDAFALCTSLTSITIPDNVTSIGDNTFYECTNLESIIIGKGVINIGEGAFCRCTNLTSITIPDNIISIDDYAFVGCTSLTDVYYSGTEEEWNEIEIGSYNTCLTSATIHYGEEAPSTTTTEATTTTTTTTTTAVTGETVYPTTELKEVVDGENTYDCVGFEVSGNKGNVITVYYTVDENSGESSCLYFGYWDDESDVWVDDTQLNLGTGDVSGSYTFKGEDQTLVLITWPDASYVSNVYYVITGSGETTTSSNATTTTTSTTTTTTTTTTTITTTTDSYDFIDSVDNWSFRNSSSNFGSSYYINSSYYNALLSGLSNTEKIKVEKILSGEWSGSCYGMATTSILACAGILEPLDYQDGATFLHDINSLPSNEVLSLINYYFALQKTTVVQQYTNQALYDTEEEK